MHPKSKEYSIEESLAEAIADGWVEIERKAADERSDEIRKSEDLLIEWAAKLATILNGPQK